MPERLRVEPPRELPRIPGVRVRQCEQDRLIRG
jgi:hypothetical protein